MLIDGISPRKINPGIGFYHFIFGPPVIQPSSNVIRTERCLKFFKNIIDRHTGFVFRAVQQLSTICFISGFGAGIVGRDSEIF
jgi:hypothetical protein